MSMARRPNPCWPAGLWLVVLLPYAGEASGSSDLRDLLHDEAWRSETFYLVQVCDATGLGDSALNSTRLEVERIFRRANVELLWLPCRRESSFQPDPPFQARVYIQSRLSEEFEAHDERMACVVGEGGKEPGPVIYISRVSVEDFIGQRKSKQLATLARAMGRVLAHELAHRFLKTSNHTPLGILQESFSRKELTGVTANGFYFTPEQSRYLHNHAKLIVQIRSKLRVVAPE